MISKEKISPGTVQNECPCVVTAQIHELVLALSLRRPGAAPKRQGEENSEESALPQQEKINDGVLERDIIDRIGTTEIDMLRGRTCYSCTILGRKVLELARCNGVTQYP